MDINKGAFCVSKLIKISVLVTIIAMSAFAEDIPFSKLKAIYSNSYELEAQERYDDALKSLSAVLKSYPNGYTVNYRMGWLAYRGGHYADAINYYKKALAIYPSSIEVMKNDILVLVAQKKWAKVESQCRQLLRVDLYNLDGNYWLAYALQSSGKDGDAIKVLNSITALYPTNVSLLLELAYSYLKIGESKTAKELYGTIIILDPNNPTALSQLEKIK